MNNFQVRPSAPGADVGMWFPPQGQSFARRSRRHTLRARAAAQPPAPERRRRPATNSAGPRIQAAARPPLGRSRAPRPRLARGVSPERPSDQRLLTALTLSRTGQSHSGARTARPEPAAVCSLRGWREGSKAYPPVQPRPKRTPDRPLHLLKRLPKNMEKVGVTGAKLSAETPCGCGCLGRRQLAIAYAPRI
jgi:hypothetical protein